VSPWHLFAVEEKVALAHQFNTYQFAAAGETVERLLAREALQQHDRHLMEMLRELVGGYAAWDRFDHKTACERLRVQAEALRHHAQDRYEKPLSAFAAVVGDNLAFLQRLQEASRGFKSPVVEHVVDLLSNADRRAEEGKYDDAVARLYRATEMAGQVAFQKHFGCATNDVPPEKLPEALRDAYTRKYGSEDKKTLKLPLVATFKALAAAGEATGKRFEERFKQLQGVLQGRNESILAHGTQPLEKKHYDAFRPLVLDLTGIAEGDLVRFPKLET
jgi:CRISPR-associated protein (TIGR02710 family)